MTNRQSRELPIIFSAPMVLALSSGKKTQARRLVKPQPESQWLELPGYELKSELVMTGSHGLEARFTHFCGGMPVDRQWMSPRYQVGDYLYCRETWTTTESIWDGDKAESFMVPAIVNPEMLIYRADGERDRRWRPSSLMPKWASRIWLEVTRVRCEQIQNISEEDAQAEGCEPEYRKYTEVKHHSNDPADHYRVSARDKFHELWDSIHGPGAWDRNDWVFVYDFRRIEKP